MRPTPALKTVHGLRETQRTGLVREIIGISPLIFSPSPLHALHTCTASKKVAVAAHPLHVDTLPSPCPFFPFRQGLRIGPS